MILQIVISLLSVLWYLEKPGRDNRHKDFWRTFISATSQCRRGYNKSSRDHTCSGADGGGGEEAAAGLGGAPRAALGVGAGRGWAGQGPRARGGAIRVSGANSSSVLSSCRWERWLWSDPFAMGPVSSSGSWESGSCGSIAAGTRLRLGVWGCHWESPPAHERSPGWAGAAAEGPGLCGEGTQAVSPWLMAGSQGSCPSGTDVWGHRGPRWPSPMSAVPQELSVVDRAGLHFKAQTLSLHSAWFTGFQSLLETSGHLFYTWELQPGSAQSPGVTGDGQGPRAIGEPAQELQELGPEAAVYPRVHSRDQILTTKG